MKLLLISILFPCVLLGQNLQEVVKKLNTSFENFKTYSSEVTYSLFDSTSSEPVEVKNGIILKEGGNLFFKLGDIEMLTTPSTIVQVDKGLKQIAYIPNQTKDQKLRDSNLKMIDKALETCGRTYLKKEGNLSYVQLDSCLFSQYQSIKFFYNPIKYFIDEIHLKTANNEELKIVYSKVKINKSLPKGTFSISKYLKDSGKEATLNELFSGYEFENYFNK